MAITPPSSGDNAGSDAVRGTAPRAGAADFTQGSIGRHLVRLTMPMFLGISAMIVASMIDAIYVSQIGTLELAAVSLTFSLVMLSTSVAMGVGIGASSIIARVAGGGASADVQRLSTHALWLVSVISVALSIAGIVFSEPLFRALGASDALMPLAREYMFVWFLGLPVFAIPMVATSIIRAVGNARTPGIIMTAAAVIQVAIAPLLMFGLPGTDWDGLGFVGSAWAFVLSRAVTGIYTYVVLRRMELISFQRVAPAVFARSAAEIMRISIPAMLANLIGPVSLAITTRLLAQHGEAVIAGFGVASRVESLATMILMALSSSVGPFVGQNWGASQDRRINGALRRTYRFSLAWGFGIAAILAVLGRPFLGLISNDPAVIDVSYLYLLVVPISYGFLGMAMMAGSTFIALGNAVPMLIMSLARMIIFYVPMALIADRLWGYAGIFGATTAANAIMALVAVVWARRMLRSAIAKRDDSSKVATSKKPPSVAAPPRISGGQE